MLPEATNVYRPVANTAAAINHLMGSYDVLEDSLNLMLEFNLNNSPGSC